MNLRLPLSAIRRLDEKFGVREWRWAFILLVTLKLVLVAHSEITTGIFDEVGYANSSLHWFGQRDIRLANFQRPPGMPWLAMMAREVGLPYRIAIELLALGSMGLLSFQLRRLVDSWLIAAIVAALLIFHPWLLTNAILFMSEPPFLAFSLGWLACQGGFLSAGTFGKKLKWVAASGLFLLLMNITRLEQPVLLAFAIVAGACLMRFSSLGLTHGESGARRMRWRWPWLLLPLFIVVAGKQLVCWINHGKSGVAAVCCLEAPGLQHFLQSLNSIQAPDPQRYAPITARSLQMAMEASPSLRLISVPMARYQGLTKTSPDPYLNNERGWLLMWDVINSSMEIRPELPPARSEVAQIDRYWQQSADEIQVALKERKLPRARYAPYPLNPNYRLWVRFYPESLWFEIRSLCRLRDSRPEMDSATVQTVEEYPWWTDAYFLINQAANRRPYLLPSSLLDGYAYGGSGPVDEVVVEAKDGTRLGGTNAMAKDFLPTELAKLLPDPPSSLVSCRYSIWVPFAIPPGARLVLLEKNIRLSAQLLSEPYHVERVPGRGAQVQAIAEIRVNQVNRPDVVGGWRKGLTEFLQCEYGWLEFMACGFCFLVAFAGADREADRSPRSGLGVLLAIMAACLLLRCAFYALSQACTLPNWDRYPQALCLWLPVILVGGSCLLGRQLGKWWAVPFTKGQ